MKTKNEVLALPLAVHTTGQPGSVFATIDIIDANGNLVCAFEDKAAEIVRRVNCHDKMKAALEHIDKVWGHKWDIETEDMIADALGWEPGEKDEFDD